MMAASDEQPAARALQTARFGNTSFQYDFIHFFMHGRSQSVYGAQVVRTAKGRGRLREAVCSCPKRESNMRSNHILEALSRKDRELLEADFETVDLPVRTQLANRRRRVEHVYFIDTGIGSIVADGNGQPIEIGIIGWDGMSSIGVLLGKTHSTHDVFMQIAGAGRRIRAESLCHADEHSISLHRVLMRYVNALYEQVGQTAVANGKSKIEERLARWLLMAHDRVEGDTFEMTHDFLGLMLATPRPGVTLAVGHLAGEGLIDTKRGKITIIDRAGLEAKCKNIYAPPAQD
jgi:CRP-like cAMP-binding protein